MNILNPKKLVKVIVIVLVVIFALFLLLMLILVGLAFLFHDQIYNLIVKITNFIFGESPDNFFKQMIQQILDNYLKGLFKGEN